MCYTDNESEQEETALRYLSVAEAAKQWGLSERSVRNYCAQGRVDGAFLTGKTWNIPDSAQKPDRRGRRAAEPTDLLSRLKAEQKAKLHGGIYHRVQIDLTYNSNHIEGSRLTEDQTRLIFETNTIDIGDCVPIDDILETVHHFRTIDYVIDTAEDALTEEIIKTLHYILKHDTQDSTLSWFAVGDYKRRANMVGGRETTKPKDVPSQMKKLLDDYNARESVSIEDVIALHAEFEYIHPFQDGNGRVGRLVALKECLHHNIIPFLIEDSKKLFYYRGIAEWRTEKGWLIDTCLDGQDSMIRLLDMLEIQHS